MRPLVSLILHEIKLHLKAYNSFASILLFFLIVMISMPFILPTQTLSDSALPMLLILGPLSLLNISYSIFKLDHSDGTLESMLHATSSDIIVLSKFLSLYFMGCIILTPLLLFSSILYNTELYRAFLLALSSTLIIPHFIALMLLISATEIYLNTNSNFIFCSILPLIIPGLILGGLIVGSSGSLIYYFSILFGINLVLLPIIYFMCCFLIKNIYNNLGKF